MTIRANRYQEVVDALKEDEIIQKMAGELYACGHKVSKLTHDDGTPTYEFMTGALDEYKGREGKLETHIGGPAEAILSVLRSQEEQARKDAA